MNLDSRGIRRILDNISFRFFQPHNPVPAEIGNMRQMRRYPNARMDVANTVFRDRDEEIYATLACLQEVDGMSTIAMAYIINELTRHTSEGECYLNIGVFKGFSFLAGVVNQDCVSIGIDNFSQFGGPEEEFRRNYQLVSHSNSAFHNIDYVNYFAEHQQIPPIGVYFYDGDHAYEHQRRALDLALPHLAERAVILVDDTNWKAPRKATLDFVMANHPRFEIVVDQTTASTGHPTYWNGMMILQKVA
ncbi:MAG: class I SAM-dependent methyltransferase [Planctomycetia bacterium]|nr:class I SAM-dependent methyltransferase [Planctomycetia bacterium]